MTDPLGGAAWAVWQGDCLERLRELPEGSVDLFATSPPYAQGLEYEHGLDWHGLRELIAGVAQAAFEPCKPSSWFWVNFGETTKYERTMAELYNEAFRSAGWLMHSRRIWAKRFAQCRLTGAMQTHTIAAAEWECIWTFRKPPNTAEVHRNKALSLRGIWTTSQPNGVSRDEHPAVYPVDLPAKAIEVWTDPGDLVCDPFCGSGTTGVAAIQLGRRFLGIELSPEYCDMARRRIGNAQPPLFADAPPEREQGSLFDEH